MELLVLPNFGPYTCRDKMVNDIRQEFEMLQSGQIEGWELFVHSSNEHGELKVWRLLDQKTKLYRYQVIGKFPDVNYRHFGDFYTDLDFRKQWDLYTQEIDVLEKKVARLDQTAAQDYKCEHPVEDDAPTLFGPIFQNLYQLVRWEIKLGMFISNREYLFKRYQFDFVNHLLVVDLESEKDRKDRHGKNHVVVARKYNSVTLLQPFDNIPDSCIFYQNYLTPLDMNMKLPKWFINWVASSGITDYIKLLRHNYKKHLLSKISKPIQDCNHKKEPSSNQVACLATGCEDN